MRWDEKRNVVDLIKLSQTWKGYNPRCVCMTLLSASFSFWWYQVENNVVSYFSFVIFSFHSLCLSFRLLVEFFSVSFSPRTPNNSCRGHSIWYNEKWHVCSAVALQSALSLYDRSLCNCFWKSKLFLAGFCQNNNENPSCLQRKIFHIFGFCVTNAK